MRPIGRYVLFLLLSITPVLVGCNSQTSGAVAKAGQAVLPQGPVVLTSPTLLQNPIKGQCCVVIAHAGGAIDGNNYTNSLEAVEANYALGTRLFELDFQKTADNHWVATHDWPEWRRLSRFKGEIPPDLATFQEQKLRLRKRNWSIAGKYTSLSLSRINEFLQQHKDARVITDTKDLDRFSDLVSTVLALPTHAQFIIQAYSMKHVEGIKQRSPDTKIILTLYRMGRPQGLYDAIAERSDFLEAITLPMNWAHDTDTLDALLALGLPLYLHGSPANINSRSLQAGFAAKGVNGFYLD